MLDEKDMKILKLLKDNSKLTSKQISKKALIPITTVHNRIKKLEKSGIIKNYTVLLNDKKLGSISAYILVTVDYKLLKEKKLSQHELAKQLKEHEFVEQTSMVTGGSDIILRVRVKDITELDNFVTRYLRNVDGIERTQTMVILNES